MVARLLHDAEDFVDEIGRHVPVEQVAHGVDEDRVGLAEAQGGVEHPLVSRHLSEVVLVIRLAHGSKAFRHPLCIAMLAARTEFRATRDRIPCGFRPFDGRFSCQISVPLCVF